MSSLCVHVCFSAKWMPTCHQWYVTSRHQQAVDRRTCKWQCAINNAPTNVHDREKTNTRVLGCHPTTEFRGVWGERSPPTDADSEGPDSEGPSEGPDAERLYFRTSKFPKIHISGKSSKSENPNIRKSRFSEIWVSGYPDFRKSGYLNIRQSGYPETPKSGHPEVKVH